MSVSWPALAGVLHDVDVNETRTLRPLQLSRPSLVVGNASEGECHDHLVNRPGVDALRRRIVATVDDNVAPPSA